MIYRLLFFFVLCIPVFCVAQSDSTSASNRIFWNDWYKLEWSDFEGEPDEREAVAALSSIGLPYGYSSDGEGSITIQINVCFLRDESWSKEAKRNSVLLQHEQLHFDIAEIHRRTIVKRLMEEEFDKKNYKEKLEKIVDEVWNNEYRKFQDKYDKETNFSRIFKEQIDWNKYVAQQLRNLEKYTFTEIEISLISFD